MSYRRKVKRRINKKKIILKILPSITLLLFIVFFGIANIKKENVYEQKIVHMQQVDKNLSRVDEENTEIKTYYVSADGTSSDGTDINNPMSLKQANKKKFNGNDRVLFKSGDIFYGTINFNVQASKNEMFYIGSYGDGEKPIISGANILINREAWSLDEQGIYKIDLSDYSNFEGIGRTYWEPYNIGFIADENGNIYGARKKSKELLVDENDFFCENNYLYIKSTKNPSDKFGKIKFVSKNSLVNISSYTILTNLNIQYAGVHGIVKKDDKDIEDVYIHDCIVQNIGGCVQNKDTFTRYGNGIEFWNQGENILVENCIVRNIYDTGFTFQGNNVTSGFINITARNNIFINCSHSVEIFCRNDKSGDDAIEIGINNCVIQNNQSINQGYGWGYNVRPDKGEVAELTIWSLPQNKSNFKVNDNKYYNSRNIRYYYSSKKNNYTLKKNTVIDNNKAYISSKTTLINGQGNYEDQSILKEYNQDQNSEITLITEEQVEQISNKKIINSNNYEEIKQYYEELEKEIQYTNVVQKIIKNYTQYVQNNKSVLAKISNSENEIEVIKNKLEKTTLETINEETIKDMLEKNYNIESSVIKANKNNKITDQEMVENIIEINKLIAQFDDIYKEADISNEFNKQDIEKHIKEAEEQVQGNEDLNISGLIELVEIGKEKLQFNNTTYADYLYSTMIETWTNSIIKEKIDNYISENPVKISYSETNLTNKDVVARIETNAKIEITNNGNKNEYTFSENGSFIFEYTIKGRTFSISANVKNIDKIPPEITGIENEKSYQNSVKPKIVDENLMNVKLIQNGQEVEYKINMTITQEGIYQLIATDKAKNETIINFNIIYPEDEKYIIKNENVQNVKGNTSITDFKDRLQLTEKYEIKRENTILDDSEKIATGDVIKTESGKEYTVIVRGDINKDGNVNIKDVVKMRKYLLTRNNLDDIEKMAADTDFDEKELNIKDLIKMRILILLSELKNVT